jgi:hypothetical protein
VGDDLFYVDGRTDRQADMTKPIVSFRNSANAPAKELYKVWRVCKEILFH